VLREEEENEAPMEAEEQGAEDPAVDEHGLEVHSYTSNVLVVVPPRGYAETTLRYARSALYNIHVGTRSVSTEADELIEGMFQDEFLVDGPLEAESMEPYSGVLFVGGEGAAELAESPDALRLAREAAEAGKLIAAWGDAVLVPIRAGIVAKRKLTGAPGLRDAARSAGARWSGTQVQRDGALVTAVDDAAGFRFARVLAEVVGIE
jgi:protease I